MAAEAVTAIAQTNSAADDGGVVSGNVLTGVGHGADDPIHVVNAGTFSSTTLGATVTLAADGSYTYDPESISGLENLAVGTYTDSFSYTAADGHGDLSTATVTITVNVAAEAVTAIAQTNSAADDGGVVSGNVLTGVGHGADDPIHVVNAGTFSSTTLGATVTLAADGSYTYDPESISGLENLAVGTYTDSFSYTAADGHGDSSTATVTITVNVAAEAVTAIAQTNSAADDGGVVSGNVLTGVGHGADDPIHVVNAGTFSSTTLGATVTLAADGSYTYDPESISGLENLAVGTYTDSFSYTAADGHGDLSTATVTITVNVAAEAVTAIAQTNSAADDGGVVSGNVLTGVGHGADDPIHVVNAGTFSSTTLGATVTLAADGSYTYDPESISGLENLAVGTYTDSFSYTAADGHGDSSTATVTITVNVAAEAVTAIAQTNSAADDGGVVSGNVLTGVGHGADDPIHVVNAGTFSSTTLGATVTLAADGSYTYDPESISGLENLAVGTYTDSFSYTAADGHGDSSTATVTITVNVAAEAVTAIAQTNSAADDGGVVSGNVLTGVGHGADDPIHVVNAGTFSSTTLGATVTLAADGSYTYDPESISGLENLAVGTYTDSFSYTAADGHGDLSTATVTITVNVAAEAVTAIAQTNSAADDGGVVSGNVLTGVGHGADDPIHVVNAGTFSSTTLGATVTLAADGSYTYDPESISGLENLAVGTYTDSFSYTAADGHGDSSTATVTITVNVAAEAVTAIAQTNSAADDGGVVSGNVLTGVGHGADDPIHVVNAGTFSSTTLGATVTLAADGSYTYDPESISGLENLAVGTYTDSFSYTAADGHGDLSTATVTITVNVAAEAVTAIAQTNSAADDGGVVSGNVLTGVGHGADDPIHVVNAGTFSSTTLGATVTLAADGSYTYDPESISGLENLAVGTYTDSFSYTAADGHGDSSTATVTVTSTWRPRR